MYVGVIELCGELPLDGRASRCVMVDRNKLEPPKVGEFTRNCYIQRLIRIRKTTTTHPPPLFIRLSSVLMKVFRCSCVYWLMCLPLLKTKKINSAFLSIASQFPEEHCFLARFPAFCRLFVPLETAPCTWKWAQNFGGMVVGRVA